LYRETALGKNLKQIGINNKLPNVGSVTVEDRKIRGYSGNKYREINIL
jgi:hypothetical protein